MDILITVTANLAVKCSSYFKRQQRGLNVTVFTKSTFLKAANNFKKCRWIITMCLYSYYTGKIHTHMEQMLSIKVYELTFSES